MKTSATKHKSKAQLLFDAAVKRMRALHDRGRYQEALDICLQITRAHPGLAIAWSDAASCCAGLGHWQDAIRYGQTALARGGNTLELYDTLALAHGQFKQWDEVRRYGLQALNMRNHRFGGDPVIPLPDLPPMPPPPSAQTRERNIIAFSLFGHDSKYCEPAVLNVQEQPNIYPHWVCRFYVDGSVPEGVINRLRAGGAQIISVQGPATQWPGPMWRLLTLDDPLAHRILFRDADSVISRREAAAVEHWLVSGKRFHMMRDSGACTELMLAGLWGVVAGSLPPLDKLMRRFMSAPLQSRHFADQNFLRQYIWPYARASLMQHDSVFGFMDAIPFPTEMTPDEHNVGYPEGSAFFTGKLDFPNGSEVTWMLYRIEKLDSGQTQEKLICSYVNAVQNGVMKIHIPMRYARWIEHGIAHIVTHVNNPA
ncbi:MAG: tetratricopeptide repeat protein [Burkholderiaceae bacterium]|nr:tetratricopeptide repeat protein [Burkholderiaceae bacterium]